MKYSFTGKKILVTAGPTREAIDPVRYISNHSSGKMGFAIARQLLNEGAYVYLVSGPVALTIDPHPALTVIKVNAAVEMYHACAALFATIDIAIFAAAVADYRPQQVAAQKIKKEGEYFSIRMIKNPDIAFEFGKLKKDDQLSIGFALETNNELTNAIGKLRRKNMDMVVLNSTNDSNATFGYDTNKITIVKNNFTRLEFPLKTKRDVAKDIVACIAELGRHAAKQELIRGTSNNWKLF